MPRVDGDCVVCMYVCTERLCSRRPYSLDCHGGAMGMYHCARENITVLVARKTESVIATDHELTVAVSSEDAVRNMQNFCVHIALSYSTR